MMFKRLLQLTLILIILFLAKEANAGIIIRPVHHFGLVGYWDFQEGTGTTANDHSGNSNHGTLTNMAENDWVDGQIGTALDFDGSDDYILSSTQNNLDSQTFSFSLWINPDSITDDSIVLFNNFDSYPGWDAWAFSMDRNYGVCNTGDICVWLGQSDSSGEYIDYAYDPPVNEWTHISATFNHVSKRIIMYVNGEQVLSKISTKVPDLLTPNGMLFGGYPDISSSHFPGLIDEVRVYNRVLSAGEIQRLYKLGSPKIGAPDNTGLVGYWKFDEGTGSKAGDHSGQANHGTLESSMTEDDWVQGKLGTALDFDGSDDYVSMGDIDNSNVMSWSFWIKPRDLRAGAEVSRILDKYKTASLSREWRICATSCGNVVLQISSTGDDNEAHGTTACPVSVGTWFHVVVVFNEGIFDVYINSIVTPDNGDFTLTSIYDSTTSFYTGAGYTTYPFNGLIDEVRIYNRALSASEVAALYKTGLGKVNNSQTNKITEGLVGIWSFDGPDMADLTAFDRSGQGNNGTLTNGPKRTIGKVGQALDFDGVNDWVSVPDNDNLSFDGDFTVSLWMKLDQLASDKGSSFLALDKGQSGGVPSWREYYIYLDDWGSPYNDVVVFMWYNSGGANYNGYYGDEEGGISAGAWYHIVGVKDSSNINIYVNGLVGSGATPSGSGWNSDQTLGIGASWNGGDSFGGLIDEVRIYNRTLTPDEIKRLYNMGR